VIDQQLEVTSESKLKTKKVGKIGYIHTPILHHIESGIVTWFIAAYSFDILKSFNSTKLIIIASNDLKSCETAHHCCCCEQSHRAAAVLWQLTV